MKRIIVTLVLLWVTALYALNTPPADTTANQKPFYENTKLTGSLLELQSWYYNEELQLAGKYPKNRLVLQSINHRFIDQKQTQVNLKTSVEYDVPFNTWNLIFGTYKNLSLFNLYLNGIIGAGDKEYDKVGSKINSSLGLTGEIGIQPKQFLEFFGGFGAQWMQTLDENVDNGEIIYPYGGVRLIIPRALKQMDVFIDGKIGMPFYRGFSYIKEGDDNFYGIGIGLRNSRPFTRAGSPLWASMETSLLFSPVLNTVETKLTFPMRLFNELSLGINAAVGTDTRTISNVNGKDEIASSFGFGAELRMFGDKLDHYFNPYLSVEKKYLEYEHGARDGNGILVYMGNKFNFMKINNLFLDVYGGPAFWKTPWARRAEDKTQKIDKPRSWNFGFGLGYKFPTEKLRVQHNYTGEIKVEQIDSYEVTSPLQPLAPITDDLMEKNIVETRNYNLIKIEPDTIIKIEYIPAKDIFGDVTDIKFFIAKLGINGSIDSLGQIPVREISERSMDNYMLIALFDREKTRVNRIKSENMFLHFTDLDHSRYFGYRWDQNRSMQPEKAARTALNNDPAKGKPLYYGLYDDYVFQMKWLDEVRSQAVDFLKIDGAIISENILAMIKSKNPSPDNSILTSEPTKQPLKQFDLANYRIAYIPFPATAVKNIMDLCSNFGISIMFRSDAQNPAGYFLQKKHTPGLLTPEQDAKYDSSYIVATDPNDAAFFSNVVHWKEFSDQLGIWVEIVKDSLIIKNFPLGYATIPDQEKEKINAFLKEKSKNATGVHLIGYTDAVPIGPNSQYKSQEDLSRARARAVFNVIRNYKNFPQDIPVITEGKGIHPLAKKTGEDPIYRRVMLYFTKKILQE